MKCIEVLYNIQCIWKHGIIREALSVQLIVPVRKDAAANIMVARTCRQLPQLVSLYKLYKDDYPKCEPAGELISYCEPASSRENKDLRVELKKI